MSDTQETRKHSRDDFYQQGADFMGSAADCAANRPQLSTGLADKILTFNFAGEIRLRHSFDDSKPELTWDFIQGGPGDSATVAYECFEMAEGVFFVSFMARPHESVACVIDLKQGVATAYVGNLPEQGEGHRIKTRVMSATIEELAGKAENLHRPSSLGGTRFANIYNDMGDGIEYEHIYLTRIYKTWLGVRGAQAGQADTEEYYVYKIQNGLYFVSWTEKLLSTQMSFLFNFLEQRQVGQVFGLTDGELVHQNIGARIRMIHSALPELQGIACVPPFAE